MISTVLVACAVGQGNPAGAKKARVWTRILSATAVVIVLMASMGCRGEPSLQATPTAALARQLVLYDWPEDIPQSVLEAFTAEFGVQVVYETYQSGQESVDHIRAGQAYDVIVVDNDLVPGLVADSLLAEIDYRNVPNFDNVSANFRDLLYDPDNRHTTPFNWGTTGLLVRSDLVGKPITRWADLWELGGIGKIAMRDDPREPLAVALKSLGYSINSEDPGQVEAALRHLIEIRANVVLVDPLADTAVPLLAQGEVVALVGWSEDALAGREMSESIAYVLPEEGPMLWGDNFAIPANSPNKRTAEAFLDFVLRPEISAQIANQNYYACANEAAYPFIDPEIRGDRVIFPASEDLLKAEVYLPLSADGEKLYAHAWERFKGTAP